MNQRQGQRGYVTEYGYRRIMVPGIRKLRMEHVLVWEAQFGTVPPGMEIHHINGDKLDNRIENLQLLTRLEHKRIHSGCVLRWGQWWKSCPKCGVHKPVTDYYVYPGRNGVMSKCRLCQIQLAGEYKRRRRASNTSNDISSKVMPEKTPAAVAGVDGGGK